MVIVYFHFILCPISYKVLLLYPTNCCYSNCNRLKQLFCYSKQWTYSSLLRFVVLLLKCNERWWWWRSTVRTNIFCFFSLLFVYFQFTCNINKLFSNRRLWGGGRTEKNTLTWQVFALQNSSSRQMVRLQYTQRDAQLRKHQTNDTSESTENNMCSVIILKRKKTGDYCTQINIGTNI